MYGMVLGEVIDLEHRNEEEFDNNCLMSLKVFNEEINNNLLNSCLFGFYCDKLSEVVNLDKEYFNTSEEEVENLKVIALVTYLAKSCMKKEDIRIVIENKYHYNINVLKDNAKDTEIIAKKSLFVFFNSNNFDDAMRLSISNDLNDICPLVGGLMEAYYGISEISKIKLFKYLEEKDFELIRKYYRKKNNKILRKE